MSIAPDPIVFKQNLLPCGATVGGAIHASLRVRTPGVSERSHIHQIGVGRVNANLGYVASIGQSDVFPRSARIGRLVDAVTVRHIATNGRLAGAHVDHVGIGGSDRNGSDRRGAKEAVGNVLPIGAGIGRFPDAAGTCSVIIHRWIAWIPGHCNHAPTPMWTDAAPGKSFPLVCDGCSPAADTVRRRVNPLIDAHLSSFRHVVTGGKLLFVPLRGVTVEVGQIGTGATAVS